METMATQEFENPGKNQAPGSFSETGQNVGNCSDIFLKFLFFAQYLTKVRGFEKKEGKGLNPKQYS